jgi:hypothetical protein
MVRGPVRVGYVHSVFRRAANLWVSPDALLAITAPSAPRVPNGFVVHDSAGLSDGAFLGLDAGMEVRVGAGVVRVPAAGLCIDLADVPIWDPRPQFSGRPISPAVLSQHLDRLAFLVRNGARAKPWSLASVLDPLAGQRPGVATLEPREEARRHRLACRARVAANALLSGIAVGDSDRLSAAAEQLAGLGHGLTPSGDDFLTGICGALALPNAGFSATAGFGQPEDRRNQTRVIAAAAAGRTTMLSATWLDHAARGEFSAEVSALLVSLADTSKAPGLEEAAARLFAVGELSGLDTAVGVLLGSRAVLSSHQG